MPPQKFWIEKAITHCRSKRQNQMSNHQNTSSSSDLFPSLCRCVCCVCHLTTSTALKPNMSSPDLRRLRVDLQLVEIDISPWNVDNWEVMIQSVILSTAPRWHGYKQFVEVDNLSMPIPRIAWFGWWKTISKQIRAHGVNWQYLEKLLRYILLSFWTCHSHL